MTIAWHSFSVLGSLAAALAFSPAQAMPLNYVVAPSSTHIGFSVDVLGLTTCHGEFSKFTGELALDLDQPALTKVAVKIDSASAAMQWSAATQMILGSSYLDAEHFPEMEFVSDRAEMLRDGKVRMDGILTLRGISHPASFIADLSERQWNPQRNAEEAEFIASGTVRRSDYHMESDQGMLDDQVTFTIRTRILLNGPSFSSALVQ
jgi:polyisoprenoid-binding protein YceI